jgi:adenylyltransferase/sulfurtransferase
MTKEISATQLKAMLDRGEEVQIIDIREEHEVDSGDISPIHIPMEDVLGNLNKIRQDIPVVFYCKTGPRSAAIVHVLRTEKGLENVMALSGGIQAWSDLIDPNVSVYG